MSSETPTFDDEYEEYNGRLKTPRKPRKSAAGRKLMRWNRTFSFQRYIIS